MRILAIGDPHGDLEKMNHNKLYKLRNYTISKMLPSDFTGSLDDFSFKNFKLVKDNFNCNTYKMQSSIDSSNLLIVNMNPCDPQSLPDEFFFLEIFIGRKAYKLKFHFYNRMFPSDLTGSLDDFFLTNYLFGGYV